MSYCNAIICVIVYICANEHNPYAWMVIYRSKHNYNPSLKCTRKCTLKCRLNSRTSRKMFSYYKSYSHRIIYIATSRNIVKRTIIKVYGDKRE